MKRQEIASLSEKEIQTRLTDLVVYLLLPQYSINKHFDRATNVLHTYVLKPGANTCLWLHLQFYYNVDGHVWYCVDSIANGERLLLEYGCSIDEVPNPDTATEDDYASAQVARDSISAVIDSFFGVQQWRGIGH